MIILHTTLLLIHKGLTVIKIAVLTITLLLSFSAQSATVQTGLLSYNDETNIITNTSNNVRYLGWDILTGLTYSETIAALNTLTVLDTEYKNFRIANQTEAYEFFNAAHFGGTQYIDTAADDSYLAPALGSNTLFGDNDIVEADLVTFISDSTTFELGTIAVTYPDIGFAGHSQILDAAANIAYFDLISVTSPVSMLVIDDSQRIPSAVPLPAAVFLFAPALLGFMSFRRKLAA